MCPLTNDRGSYKHDKYFRYSNRFQGGTGSILVFGDAWSLYPSRFEHQIVLIKFTSSGAVGCPEKSTSSLPKPRLPQVINQFPLLNVVQETSQFPKRQDTTTAGTVPVTAGPSELWMSRDICRVLGGFCQASKARNLISQNC